MGGRETADQSEKASFWSAQRSPKQALSSRPQGQHEAIIRQMGLEWPFPSGRHLCLGEVSVHLGCSRAWRTSKRMGCGSESCWTPLTLAGPHLSSLPHPRGPTGPLSSPQGCIVIRYTAPWHMVFFSETLGIPSLRVLAQKLLELLFDYEVEKEPLLFHVFSNAGVMLYRYVLELLQTHQRFCHLRVVGTIFDSGPGDSNLLGALRALAVVLEHRPAALRLLLLVAFTLVAFLFHVLLAPLTALFHTHFYDRLLDAASRWPELYLYSRADEVVLARDVERMVEARLAHQVLVRSVDFVSSAHVSHLRDYPTYYTTLCITFMHSCVHCSGPCPPHLTSAPEINA